jgi:hypothetical protein
MTDLYVPIAGQSTPIGYAAVFQMGTNGGLPAWAQYVAQAGTWNVVASGSVSITGGVSISNFPASQAVTAVDGGIATIGAVADTAWTSGNGTVIALLKGIVAAIKGTLTTVIGAGSALIGGVNLVDSAGTNKASISAGGAVKTDGSAVTQPSSIADGGAVTIGALADAAWVSGNGSAIAVLKAIVAAVKGTLNVSGPTLTYVDRSITITAGGTAQLLMAANASPQVDGDSQHLHQRRRHLVLVHFYDSDPERRRAVTVCPL